MPEALNLSLIVYGLGIFIALLAALLIKGIVGLLSWTDRAAAAPGAGMAKPAPAPTPAQAQAQAQAVAADVPPHHLVVIAACAHAMVGAHRILHIGSNAGAAGWSAEGRFAQHGSHHPSTHH
ncbi:hypothetical protein [Magnetospirillum sulfuroxidans]|uniref:Uncharacterized protein n=1 Tax=Magnetospirillum sulfuroxidans TaxID=611300 RepID=A0ABS5IAI7_9PROT|nr:hypothetical protein [Magnetospirillum sulfuroxidans]MBR9971440.1 hypothetical protein [Magnetospirillum sulfuroxidans]